MFVDQKKKKHAHFLEIIKTVIFMVDILDFVVLHILCVVT